MRIFVFAVFFLSLTLVQAKAEEMGPAPKLLGKYAKLVVRQSLWQYGFNAYKQAQMKDVVKVRRASLLKRKSGKKAVLRDPLFKQLVESL
jgi:hypothetical protein